MTCEMKREKGFAFRSWLDSPSQPALFTTPPAISTTTSTRTTTALLLLLLLLFSFCPHDTKSSSDQFNSLRPLRRSSLSAFRLRSFAFGLGLLVDCCLFFLLFSLSTIRFVSSCHHASQHACFVCGCVMIAIDWHRCRPRRIAITNTSPSKMVFFLGL